MGNRVIEWLDQSHDRLVVAPALKTQGPLPHCWKKIGGRQSLGDVVLQPKAVQTHPGQYDRIKLN